VAFLAVVVTAALLTMLDNTVVTVAAPSIARDLAASMSALEWVANGYMLSYAGLLMAGGRLADRYGVKPVLLAGIAVFTVASAAAGLSREVTVLVAARVVQGAGAALLVPATLAAVGARAERERLRAAAAWTVAGAVGLAAGPVVGGALSQHLHWSWIFLINVPVGLAAFAVAGRLPAGPGDRTAVGTVAGLFAVRAYRGGVIVQLLWGLGVTSVAFFTSFYLQEVRRFPPVTAGLVFVPVAVAVGLGAPVAGRLMRRCGAARTVAAGLGLVGAGIGAVAIGGGSTPLLLAALAAIGFGSALTVPLAAVVLAAAPPGQGGTAAGVFAVARELSGVLGVAGIGAVVSAGGYPLGLAVAAVLVWCGALVGARTLPGTGSGAERSHQQRPGGVQLTLPVRPRMGPVAVEVDGGRDPGE
jgi:MFS family permease